jgi:hypothetical protein
MTSGHFEMKRMFSATLKLFLELERENIISDVNERTLCGRFATYLQRAADESGLKGYFADVEYNRNLGRVKTILDAEKRVVSIVCDVILHSRGKIVRRDNLIALEMKKAQRPSGEKVEDRNRLRALTKASYDNIWSADGGVLPEHVCGYQLGYYLELDSRATTYLLEEYRSGELLRSKSGNF